MDVDAPIAGGEDGEAGHVVVAVGLVGAQCTSQVGLAQLGYDEPDQREGLVVQIPDGVAGHVGDGPPPDVQLGQAHRLYVIPG